MSNLIRIACARVRPRSIGAGSVMSLAVAGLLAGVRTMTGPAQAQDFFNIGRALMQPHYQNGGNYNRRHRGGSTASRRPSQNADSSGQTTQAPAQTATSGSQSTPPATPAAETRARSEPRGGPEFAPPK